MKAASSAEPCLTGRVSLGARGARRLAAEAAEDDREERAVHALAHDVGEDRARGADQRAGDDQRHVAEREADARRRPARIGIEHRDDDRHVGAADRNDQRHAERQRDRSRSARRRTRTACRRTARSAATRPTPSALLITWRCGSRIGAPDMRPSSLAKAMIEPVKVTAPIARPSDISIRLPGWMPAPSAMPKACGA